MILLNRCPCVGQLGKPRKVVFMIEPEILFRGARPFRQRLHLFAAFDLAEIFLDPFLRLYGIEVTCDHQCYVVWDIPTAVKLLNIGECRILQIVERADNLPVVRMVLRARGLIDHVIRVSVRNVIDGLPLLVLYHLLLFREYGLGHCVNEPAQLVGFCPEHFLERIFGHRLKIICPVAVG